jgi:ABC-2 type transport system permease protein
MSPQTNAVRLGVARGWIEFQVYYLKDLSGLIGTIILAFLLVGVLWFERATNVQGVSLALVTLPGLLAMLIANEGFSSVARFLSAHREDGTLLRAKAIPQGMPGYLLARVVVTILATIFNLALVFVLSLFVVPGLGLTHIAGGRLLTLVWVVMLGLLATAPIGAIIGSLVKSSSAGFGLTFLPLVALVAISGIFYPISALPAWVQWIAQVFPIYWLGVGLRSVFSPAAAALEPGGTFHPLATLLVLAAWAVFGLLLALPVLRRMARRTSGGEMEAGKQRSLRGAG